MNKANLPSEKENQINENLEKESIFTKFQNKISQKVKNLKLLLAFFESLKHYFIKQMKKKKLLLKILKLIKISKK